jgi:hypothetical protein
VKADSKPFASLPGSRFGARRLAYALSVAALLLLSLPTFASAVAKQPVDFFGGSGALGGKFEGTPQGIAVNQSGSGAGNPGDIYVTDTLDNRVERFARDDHGTPADGSDDTYSFVSAWGAGVEPSSGTGYEVCTVSEKCSEAIASGIAGGLFNPAGIAVDGDTGDVYVADPGNERVDIFSGEGAFLRAFGFDTVQSGPDDNGSGYEVCVPASGDVCKAGVPGSGLGQVGGPIPSGAELQMGIAVSQPDGNPATGTVFLADRENSRVNTYHLDGSSPASIGSSSVFSSGKFVESPRQVAVDSRGILYASNGIYLDASVERYDTENANGNGIGFLEPISAPTNEQALLRVKATSGQFRLSFDPDEGGPEPAQITPNLPFNANAAQIKTTLEALPAVGAGNIAGVRTSTSSEIGHPLYEIEFGGSLAHTNLPPLTVINGSEPISPSGSVYIDAGSPATYDGADGPLPRGEIHALYVEPDLDGGGPDTDVLNVFLGESIIDQFGPTNQPGLSAPPTAMDAALNVEGLSGGFGLASDQASGRIYVGAEDFGEGTGFGIYVLDTPTGPGPSATLDSVSGITATSVTAHATITPNGTPALRYRLEYSSDGTNWESGPTVNLGTQATPQSVSEALSPPGGLEPNTFYHLRLVAKRPFFPAVVTSEQTFTTLPSPPLVETTGSPVRTTTAVRLDGRLSPQGSPATYRFEYGTQGPCESNPCTATESQPAGSSGEFELVSQQLEGLEPNTTYHYRLVADNGNPGSPVFGEDMTVDTFANEAPLSHGHFPGPVGSDRAWELVSEPDTSGNGVGRSFSPLAAAISDNGDRAVYGVAGGTPLSESGTFQTRLFAERTPAGWQTKKIFPSRQQVSTEWATPGGSSDLSSMIDLNHASVQSGEFGIWHLSPSAAPVKLFGSPDQSIKSPEGFLASSDDGSRTLIAMSGTQDPSHPVAPGTANLYDISSGPPRLVDLLPDGRVAACGLKEGGPTGFGVDPERSAHWISPDGSLAFFPTTNCGPVTRLYARDFLAETTKLVSGAPYSGPLCSSSFVKSTAGSAYFATETRLTAEDLEPEGCASGRYGDVYRYDLGDGSLHCLTCLAPGYPAAVGAVGIVEAATVGIADGSHIYFVSKRRLLPGAPLSGGTYGIDVGSGKLAYVGASEYVSDHGESAMSRSGSTVAFRSKAARLNAIGGQQNGGTLQDYLFDFDDRSLTCVSCPADGSAPVGPVHGIQGGGVSGGVTKGQGANRGQSLDASGEDFIFATPTPLVSADQNTARAGQDPQAGNDVYEWRAGKLLLVSDGITDWPGNETPGIAGITPSGHDIFFSEAAELTPDALDGYNRLYDARIGGGFEFPTPPKPCPLEVCQGTPKGAPEEQAPGTESIQGAGNGSEAAKGRCPKQKARRHGRCVPKQHKHAKKTARHRRAEHNRRAAR